MRLSPLSRRYFFFSSISFLFSCLPLSLMSRFDRSPRTLFALSRRFPSFSLLSPLCLRSFFFFSSNSFCSLFPLFAIFLFVLCSLFALTHISRALLLHSLLSSFTSLYSLYPPSPLSIPIFILLVMILLIFPSSKTTHLGQKRA